MCLLPIDHANENSDPVWNPLLFSTSYGRGTQPLSVYTALFNTLLKKNLQAFSKFTEEETEAQKG